MEDAQSDSPTTVGEIAILTNEQADLSKGILE
jgi:hypothetical protein